MVLARGAPSPEAPLRGIFEYDQAVALRQQAHEVVLAVLDARSARHWRKFGTRVEHAVERDDGITVVRLDVPVGAVSARTDHRVHAWAARRLHRTVTSEWGTPDVIHAHFARFAAAATRAECPEPLVWTEHDSHLANPDRRLTEDISVAGDRADAVVSVSQLRIIGDGPQRRPLETIAANNPNIVLLGTQPRERIAEELAGADAFALASHSETFGVVCAEALAAGLPVLTTECGGPQEFIDDSNGMVVPVGDVDALADGRHRSIGGGLPTGDLQPCDDRLSLGGRLAGMDLTAWMASVNGVIAANASHPWVVAALGGLCVIDGFFPPVPSESLVVALAAVGHPPWWVIVPVAALGAMCGDNIAYWIGHQLGHTKLFNGGPKRQRTVAWATHQLLVRGPLCILVARYIPGGRVIVNAMAGATRFSYRVFLPVDALAGVLWAGYATGIGAGAASFLGNNHILAATVGIIGAIVIGVILDQVLRRVMPAPQND